MAGQDGYLARARMLLAAREAGDTDGSTPVDSDSVHHASSLHTPADQSTNRPIGASELRQEYARNAINEKSPLPSSPPPTVAEVTVRLRARLSKRLQHWEDDRLQALALWHLVVAFERSGASGFRRHLPAAVAALSDDELAVLVDWPSLAAMEQAAFVSDPETGALLSRGARKLAGWWNARRTR